MLLAGALLLFSACASHKARVRQDKVEKVISAARSYIGTPYKYGVQPVPAWTARDC